MRERKLRFGVTSAGQPKQSVAGDVQAGRGTDRAGVAARLALLCATLAQAFTTEASALSRKSTSFQIRVGLLWVRSFVSINAYCDSGLLHYRLQSAEPRSISIRVSAFGQEPN